MKANRCSEGGCDELPSRMGLCLDHYRSWWERKSQELKEKGMTQPAWACFNEEDAWREYEVLWQVTGEGEMEPCRDCTPRYRDQMKAEGLCRRPETIFIRRPYNGGSQVFGLSSMIQPSKWRRAILGIGSELVHGTDPKSRDAAMELIDEQSRQG